MSGTRRIGDLPLDQTCRHPEHFPPQLISLRPGLYEHVCPGCGSRREFTVRGATL